MKNPLNEVIDATRSIINDDKSLRNLLLFSVVFFTAFVLLPVLLIPGNSFWFQLSLLRPRDFMLFIPLSLAAALMVQMQMFLFSKMRSAKERAVAVGQGGVGAYSAIFGGMLATAACSSCVAGLLGFLGAGSIFFIVRNSPLFIAGAFVLMSLSLYLASRKVNGHCRSCKVEV